MHKTTNYGGGGGGGGDGGDNNGDDDNNYRQTNERTIERTTNQLVMRMMVNERF